MTEGLGDFFKLIAEDKKKKKEEFDELVGEINLDSLFSEIKGSIEEDKENSKKVQKQAAAFESWLLSDTEEEKEEIVAEVAEDFKEEVDTTDWRDDYVPTEIETEDLIKPEPLKPTPSVIDQSIKILDEITEETDPLNDTQFATFDDLKKHYQLFLDRISVQLSTIGGGGIEDAPKTGGPYARRNQAWEVISSSGGSSVWEVDTIGINTTNSVGIGTTAKDGYSLYVQGDARITGILTVGESSVTINGVDDKIIIGSGTTITSGGDADYVGVLTAKNVSIANTFTYPPYITGGTVPKAIKSQGGYGRSSAFDEYQTGTEASQDPSDYVEYTQEMANTGTWKRFGITTAGNQARDGNWWGETNPNYDQSKGLFGGLTNPAGVQNFFDFSENTAFNNAQTTGSLKYTQAVGSFSLKECNVGDLVLARFDLNIMPMVTNTTVEVALIYANRDASDNITFTFPLTITPFTYGNGTVGRGYLLRPTITAYIANDQDINSRSLLAIKADNPILVNPIGVLFTIQR
jgi:hypothetical protein